MNKFINDLEFGQEYEKKLISIMCMTDYTISDGLFKDFDIVDNSNKETFYEVKADRMAYKTNNIAIEFQCNNKPSGIETSKANYWAIFIIKENNKNDLYIISRKRLLKFIRKDLYHNIVRGGDNKKSLMYLFDLDLFKNYLFSSDN